LILNFLKDSLQFRVKKSIQKSFVLIHMDLKFLYNDAQKWHQLILYILNCELKKENEEVSSSED